MALTFPLPLADFFDDLCVAEASFTLGEAMQHSRTGGGDIISADLGPRLWQGQVQLRARRIEDADRITARIDALRNGGRTFYATPYGKGFPQADPDGTILGLATPTIDTVFASRVQIRIADLPVGYVLSGGDYIGWDYGTPVRTALHQITVGAVADGSGEALVEVSNFIRTGAVPGLSVRLINPFCKARLVPDAFVPFTSRRRRWSDGASFSFIQTLR
jgi:hypothetical protein